MIKKSYPINMEIYKPVSDISGLKEFIYEQITEDNNDNAKILIYQDLFNSEIHIFVKENTFNKIISYACMDYENENRYLMTIKFFINIKSRYFKSLNILYYGDRDDLTKLESDLSMHITDLHTLMKKQRYICEIDYKKYFTISEIAIYFVNDCTNSLEEFFIPDAVYDEIIMLSKISDKITIDEDTFIDKVENLSLLSHKVSCFLFAWYSDCFDNDENTIKVHIDDRQVGSTYRLIQAKNRIGCKMLVANQMQKKAVLHNFAGNENIITISDLLNKRIPAQLTDLVIDDGISVLKALLEVFNYNLKEIVIKKDIGVSIEENYTEDRND